MVHILALSEDLDAYILLSKSPLKNISDSTDLPLLPRHDVRFDARFREDIVFEKNSGQDTETEVFIFPVPKFWYHLKIGGFSAR